jgi:hypothetical protein
MTCPGVESEHGIKSDRCPSVDVNWRRSLWLLMTYYETFAGRRGPIIPYLAIWYCHGSHRTMLTTAGHTPHRVRRYRVMVQEVVTFRCPQCVATGISITAQDISRTLPSSIESQNWEVLGALCHSHWTVMMIISPRQERVRANAGLPNQAVFVIISP